MPKIYLKQTGSYTDGTVNVSEDSYKPSNLFKRFKHAPANGQTWNSGEKISISEKSEGKRFLTLKPGKEYKDKKLEHAYVYFNRYDTGYKKPLLFSLHFKNEKSESKFMYLQYSEFKILLRLKSIVISDMRESENDKEIFSLLIAENFIRHDSLTYQIDKDNINGQDKKYLYGSIKISKKEYIENDQSNEFYKYTHRPIGGARKSYLLYDRQVLTKKENGAIEEIQGVEYKEVKVYFGSKAKKTSSSKKSETIEVPLLIKLTKTAKSTEPDYYVHKRNSNGYYWEQLPGNNGKGEVLCDLLTDMGFGMTNGEPGYQQLKTLLLGSGVIKGQGDPELVSKIHTITNGQLKTILEKQVGDTGSQKSFLELLLTRIEFDLLDSVVILLEKTPTASPYGETAVSTVVQQLQPPREINRVNMNEGGDKTITVSDATSSKGECVKTYKYRVYEHNFRSGNLALTNHIKINAYRLIKEFKTRKSYSQNRVQL